MSKAHMTPLTGRKSWASGDAEGVPPRSMTGRRQWPDQSPSLAGRRHRHRRRHGRRRNGHWAPRAEPLRDEPWSLGFGAATAAGADAVAVEKNVVRALSNPKGEFRNSHARTPHQLFKRHRHAEQPALLHQSLRHSGYRSGQAQARDPRHGATAAGIHAGVAVALSAGHPHGLRRMRRQFGADVRQGADASDGRALSTASSPIRNGPACRCRRCSTRPASIPARNG